MPMLPTRTSVCTESGWLTITPRRVRQDLQRAVEAVFHDEQADVAEIGACAGAQAAADEIDLVIQLARRHRRRPLIEQRRGQVRETGLPFRIERAARADEQPDADDRLLVVRDGDHA